MHQVCFDKCSLVLSTSSVISACSLVSTLCATRKSLVCSKICIDILRAFSDSKVPVDYFALLAELMRLRGLRLDELKEQAQLKSQLQSAGGGSLNTVLDSTLLASLRTPCWSARTMLSTRVFSCI